MHTSLLCAHGPEYAKVKNNSSSSSSNNNNGDNGNGNIERNLHHSDSSVDLLCTEHLASDNLFGNSTGSGGNGIDYYDGNEDDRKVPGNNDLMAGTSGTAAGNFGNSALNGTLYRNGFAHVNTAGIDPIFLEDRCLDNLLKSEEKWTEIHSFSKTVQTEITPAMRRIVVEWMMEVCEEQKCQEEVVLLALNYMDRFLAAILVGKTHLQILATSCLLLASKLREPSCRGLSADLLVLYTDNSIVKRDLLNWELYVLSNLKWDLSCVTPLDFLELLLSRLPITSKKCPDISREKVRQHSQAFIWLTAKDYCFSVFSASTIAASSIAAALSGLNWHLRAGIGLEHLLNRLTDLIGIEQEHLRECMNKMEYVFREHTRNILSFSVSTTPTTNATTVDSQQKLGSNNNNNKNNNNNNNNNNNTNIDNNNSSCKMLPSVISSSLTLSPASSTASSSPSSMSGNELDNYKREAGTPTDVQDVKF